MPRTVIEAGGREGIARRDWWDEGGLVCVDEPFFYLFKSRELCCRLKSGAVSKLGG